VHEYSSTVASGGWGAGHNYTLSFAGEMMHDNHCVLRHNTIKLEAITAGACSILGWVTEKYPANDGFKLQEEYSTGMCIYFLLSSPSIVK